MDDTPEEIDFAEWAESSGTDYSEHQFDLLKRENRKLRKQQAVKGATTAFLIKAIEDSYIDPPALNIKRPRRDRRTSVPKAIGVCHLSDTQIGKQTATYDSQIADERLMEYMEAVLEIVEDNRAHSRIDELRFYWGGDMIEGELIFPHQAHLIDQPVIEQAVKTAPSVLARMVLLALEHVEKVHVVAVPGNHGRPASKHAGSHPKTNWDTVCYEVARLMVLGPQGAQNRNIAKRCSFNIPDSWYAVDRVFDEGNLVVHGHQIRGGFGGFPFYGVGKKMAGWIDSIPEDWKNLYFGHFHQYYSGEINLHRWFCNGTTESDNDFAREELASCGTPKQRFQIFNDRHGLVSDYPIYLNSALDTAQKG